MGSTDGGPQTIYTGIIFLSLVYTITELYNKKSYDI